ncbi:hypothetical protein ACFFX0_03175 [Citricoccus parietis]|uniref:Uncharacterized protein n=1 Tax=Citricoccus parietis TaxID=592307 RepID=A0ABV5FU89_9MICC
MLGESLQPPTSTRLRLQAPLPSASSLLRASRAPERSWPARSRWPARTILRRTNSATHSMKHRARQIHSTPTWHSAQRRTTPPLPHHQNTQPTPNPRPLHRPEQPVGQDDSPDRSCRPLHQGHRATDHEPGNQLIPRRGSTPSPRLANTHQHCSPARSRLPGSRTV